MLAWICGSVRRPGCITATSNKRPSPWQTTQDSWIAGPPGKTTQEHLSSGVSLTTLVRQRSASLEEVVPSPVVSQMQEGEQLLIPTAAFRTNWQSTALGSGRLVAG